MRTRELIAVIVACATLLGIAWIMAGCDETTAREQTRQVEVLHTNDPLTKPNYFLHPGA